MQSEPVSPPPITTTCLPVALRLTSVGNDIARDALVLLRQEFHGEVHALRIRGPVPAGRAAVRNRRSATTASNSAEQLLRRQCHADMRVGAELHAFGLHLFDAAVDVRFSILKSGMP